MTEKKCQLTEKLRNYVYRYGTELSDDKLKKKGTSLEENIENFSDMEDIAMSIYSVLLLKRYSKNTISTDGTRLTFYYWLETKSTSAFLTCHLPSATN